MSLTVGRTKLGVWLGDRLCLRFASDDMPLLCLLLSPLSCVMDTDSYSSRYYVCVGNASDPLSYGL